MIAAREGHSPVEFFCLPWGRYRLLNKNGESALVWRHGGASWMSSNGYWSGRAHHAGERQWSAGLTAVFSGMPKWRST